MPWDVFISHASEDKASVADPLTEALLAENLLVWYDTMELRVGDSLRASIEKGLRESKFGVIILSPAFFGKHWPTLELNALAQKEVNGEKVILPVWYNVTIEDVRSESLLLADRVAANWSSGIDSVVASLLAAIQPPNRNDKTSRSNERDDSLRELAITSPKTAIKETWKNLVSVITDEARQALPIDDGKRMTATELVNQLSQRGKINEEMREEFFRLKKWHDSAAIWNSHQEPKDALTFADLTYSLMRKFEAIHQ